jgi:hypothetical protein
MARKKAQREKATRVHSARRSTRHVREVPWVSTRADATWRPLTTMAELNERYALPRNVPLEITFMDLGFLMGRCVMLEERLEQMARYIRQLEFDAARK